MTNNYTGVLKIGSNTQNGRKLPIPKEWPVKVILVSGNSKREITTRYSLYMLRRCSLRARSELKDKEKGLHYGTEIEWELAISKVENTTPSGPYAMLLDWFATLPQRAAPAVADKPERHSVPKSRLDSLTWKQAFLLQVAMRDINPAGFIDSHQVRGRILSQLQTSPLTASDLVLACKLFKGKDEGIYQRALNHTVTFLDSEGMDQPAEFSELAKTHHDIDKALWAIHYRRLRKSSHHGPASEVSSWD